jgi:polygalacturonase
MDRRKFLSGAAQSAIALPLLADAAHAATHPSKVKPRKITGASPMQPGPHAVHLNVRDFGATGDGKTMDTLALQQTLDRCNLLGGGEVLLPAGEYLTGALSIRSNTTLRLSEGATLQGSPDLKDYTLTQVRWEGKFIKGYLGLISAIDAENVTITGTGKILGNTAIPGRVQKATGWRHPTLLEFVNCRNLLVETVYTRQNAMWSTHPIFCSDVTFRNVAIHGGADGIDVDSCRNVLIENCTFETSDDCISLKSGRGMEGNTIARPCEDVRIVNCSFVDHVWACIGIGSELSAGVRNVRVENCKCLGARTFAIYIKTHVGRGAFIEDIYMDGLEVSNAKLGFLRINLLDSGKQDENPVPGLAGIPNVRNLQFTNIKVTDMPLLVDAMFIHPAKPLDGLVLRDITGTCAKGLELSNIRHAVLSNIHVTGFSGPLLQTHDVTGTGLQGAVAIEPAKTVDPLPVPASPYVLG